MQALTLLVCVWKVSLPVSGNLVAVCGQPGTAAVIPPGTAFYVLRYLVIAKLDFLHAQ
jgi:hypothetical protein